jgi:pyruvate/2-oxoglutarate/acetoin dehydrogenase E1 component
MKETMATSSDRGEITYREALRQALRKELLADPRVIVLGEDVGRYGGAYAVTKGLLEEFGDAGTGVHELQHLHVPLDSS